MALTWQEACALFFDKAWSDFCFSPSEDIQSLIEQTALCTTREVTQEDIDNGEFDDLDVGDSVHVLSPLGQQAIDKAAEVRKREGS